MLRVAGGEVRALHPRDEVLFGPPLGDDEADLALIVGPQQLEGLEALGSSDRHWVMTRQTSRSSLGRSSWKDSKPSADETFPARVAKRCAKSSNRSRGTVMALILTMLTGEIVAETTKGAPNGRPSKLKRIGR